jgi:hypothetical protein
MSFGVIKNDPDANFAFLDDLQRNVEQSRDVKQEIGDVFIALGEVYLGEAADGLDVARLQVDKDMDGIIEEFDALRVEAINHLNQMIDIDRAGRNAFPV